MRRIAICGLSFTKTSFRITLPMVKFSKKITEHKM